MDISTIKKSCQNYFDLNKNIQKFKNSKDDKVKTKALAHLIFKILSYCTLVVPAGVGLVYGLSSLYGRITKVKKPSQQNQDVSVKGQDVLGLNKNISFKKDVNIPELQNKANEHFADYKFKDEAGACVILVLNDPEFKKDPDAYIKAWIKRRGRSEGEDAALSFFKNELKLTPLV